MLLPFLFYDRIKSVYESVREWLRLVFRQDLIYLLSCPIPECPLTVRLPAVDVLPVE